MKVTTYAPPFRPPFSGLWKICILSTAIFQQKLGKCRISTPIFHQNWAKCIVSTPLFCEARRASHCHSPQTTYSSKSTCCAISAQNPAMHVVVYSVDLHHSARSWKLSTGNEVIAKFNIPADDTNAFAPWLNYVPWKMPDVRSRYALYTNMRWFIYCMLYLMYECSAAFTIRSVSLPLITLFSHDSLTKIRPLPLISVRLLFILYCYNLQTRCISLVLKFQTTLSTYMVLGPPGNLLMRSYYSTLPSKINLWEGKLIITSGPSR